MKTKSINYIIYIIIIIIHNTLASEEEFCTISKKLDEQCGSYTYKVVKPLLDYIKQIENNNCENKNKEILELKDKLIQSKDQIIELQNQKLRTNEREMHPVAQILQSNFTSPFSYQWKRLRFSDDMLSFDVNCVPFSHTPGVHTIFTSETDAINVLCDSVIAGLGWTVIQKRTTGNESFFRDWRTYSEGFGSLSNDFFLGLETIYRLTNSEQYELYIEMHKFNGLHEYARFDRFAIASKQHNYALISLGKYSGNGQGNPMISQLGVPFSTFDHNFYLSNCASKRHSGWWFGNCSGSNLNGEFFDHEVKALRAMSWEENRSLKKVVMLIRPKRK